MTGMSNGAELCYLIACEAPEFLKHLLQLQEQSSLMV